MSEFKFACPVCGQHITADSKSAGSQLECPTCFRKIVVPQAPSSSDPKFILAAAEANKPRPPSTGPPAAMGPIQTRPARSSVPVAVVMVLILVCAAGTTLFVLRGKLFKSDRGQAQGTSTNDLAGGGNGIPPATNTLPWTLDVADAAYPEDIASGRIRGRDFVCERATLQGGTLTLRHGRSGTPDLGITIYFYSKQPAVLAGRTLGVTTNNTGAPRVVYRWKENGQAMSGTFLNGYALKIEFGEIGPGGLPGKIYICLPDSYESCVAGTFNAEIRYPSPPKQRQPQPAQPKR